MRSKKRFFLQGKSSASDSHDFICTDCRIHSDAVGLNEASRQRTSMGMHSSEVWSVNPSDVDYCSCGLHYIERFRQFVNRIFSKVTGADVAIHDETREVMVLKKVKSSDWRKWILPRIRETAINLFALKRIWGASIREIARIARWYRTQSITFYVPRKNSDRKLRTISWRFQDKLSSLSSCASTVEAAVKLHDVLMHDPRMSQPIQTLHESDGADFDKDPEPVGFLEFRVSLKKNLNPSVPVSEVYGSFTSSVLCDHTSVMSSTRIGDKSSQNSLRKKKEWPPYHSVSWTYDHELNRKYAWKSLLGFSFQHQAPSSASERR